MQNIRNIAIIAHVDHGKTTLVDKMLMAGHLFRDNQQTDDLYLDSNDLERERGITILSKNVSIRYKGVKINIIDTPGHADFGGEVERVLNMADGCLLVVDAFEGPMPQTRFVLEKALELGLKPVVVVNKVDKPNCRPEETQEKVFDLMFNLEATEDQLDFPTIYGSAKQGWMSEDWKKPTEDIFALLDAIIEHIPAPVPLEGTPQMLITSLDFSNYVGRIAVGRVHRGSIVPNKDYALCKRLGVIKKIRIKELNVFEGLGRIKTDEVKSGDICALIGVEGFEIGDTITDYENPDPLPTIAIDEPTMSMLFTINNSPFFGQDGKFVTSRHIHDRLMRELDKNLALRVEDTGNADSWTVFGRGVLHLSILIETMRREGYEFQISKPEVLFKEVDGKKMEPIENVIIDVSNEFVGSVIEKLGQRKGELLGMTEATGGYARLEFTIPARGLIGYRQEFMTDTKGNGIINTIFDKYAPYKGDIPRRKMGSIIVFETGETTAYGLHAAESRGVLFLGAGVQVYAGMVVGENPKGQDIEVNVTRKKQQTNVRSSGTDESLRLSPPNIMSLEEALEFIEEDELIEITPLSFRIRKRILDSSKRYRSKK